MHRHHKDPAELRKLVPKFRNGEFVLKRGRGKDTEVLSGKTERIEAPDLTTQRMTIYCQVLYRQRIGCKADFSTAERWEAVPPPPSGILFEYSWFYPQPTYERLKLESVPNNERCWLCSHENPMHLELFRTMLMTLFLKESLEKNSSLQKWLRRLRDRIVLLL
ncbi:MAG TPA: hypothetical protein DEF00_00185 [Candidatus Taylorbacteria bacterium]|nr:MAG: hypothetical protein UY03_C0013G0012 [Parcubacteria group bacterium GW2011_GWA2_47_64]KKU96007.1 MAG: hypothetical protein UY29_C0017G0011 [Parcubacteria group bacterium GW2011_GWC2_48_17]HBV00799.1 hypothetical protein [Candidatus Taylorbacteria bacterium]